MVKEQTETAKGMDLLQEEYPEGQVKCQESLVRKGKVSTLRWDMPRCAIKIKQKNGKASASGKLGEPFS